VDSQVSHNRCTGALERHTVASVQKPKVRCRRMRIITHQSVIKTTILLYIATPSGITAACDAMGAVLIIGRWKPFV
jgi:hypothetical protein